MKDDRDEALRELVARAQAIIARARALTEGSRREVDAVRRSLAETREEPQPEKRSVARG